MSETFLFNVPVLPAGEEVWIGVSYGGLQQPIDIKVAQVDGRPALVALRIDNGIEITSRSLRSIKVPTLAKQLVEHVRQLMAEIEPTDQELDALRRYTGPLHPDWTDEAARYLTIAEMGAAADSLRRWLDALEDVDTGVLESRPRGRGAPPPTDTELRTFAKVYLEELTLGSYGAKTRTAARLHINRSTVYTWIRVCRDRDLLPKEEQ